ncbi:MAG: recombinase family protein [Brevundimonas sp.]|uniref:recombinase family protein n=1 Tax=Brevundimonas sp. TaxID=1871086 RepID=UPI0039193749
MEQDFNSLDAQREACAAYVTSQKGEGWVELPKRYDDGGYSSGNMQRPGLLRLLADIEAGRIDVVVVYKVDRLTRSLSDFARIVERFDRCNVSFVSVTQAFNTTTSMGRLTLNVLLSFAQFEREVTGERIRDKIAASKKKGMWMGGNSPLGYIPDGRTLKVIPEEADTVRWCFVRYLELGSVYELQREMKAASIVSRIRTSKAGNTTGGQRRLPLSRVLGVIPGDLVGLDVGFGGL